MSSLVFHRLTPKRAVRRPIRRAPGHLHPRLALQRRALEAAGPRPGLPGLPRRRPGHAGLWPLQRAQGRRHRVPPREACLGHARPAGAPAARQGRVGRPRLGCGPRLVFCGAAPGEVRWCQLRFCAVPCVGGRYRVLGFLVEPRYLPRGRVPTCSMYVLDFRATFSAHPQLTKSWLQLAVLVSLSRLRGLTC